MDEKPPPQPLPNAMLAAVKAHRLYRVAGGYLVAAWVVLQVAAIVLPGFGAPAWVLRALIILLALGFGGALLAGWGYDRRAAGLPLFPRAPRSRLAWGLLAFLPAALVSAFFLARPMARTATPRVETAAATAAMPPVPEKSVAVLPFENFSEDKDNAFFADGVQDEVLTDLSKVADLKVISRTSVMQYKGASRNLREIAQALGVAYVVEGSVQRAGNQIRVVAQLIDARTDAHKWADHYDRDLANVFTIQSEIARDIAGQLQAVISPQEHAAMMEVPTRDEEAYQLYLRAVSEFDMTGVGSLNARPATERAIDLLRQATARDPNFVRAFTLLTAVQAYNYSLFNHTPDAAEATRLSAETVARLRPGSIEASVALGCYDYYILRDYPRAADAFTEVTRQSPNDARAWNYLGAIDRRRGRWEDALAALGRAMELDPASDAAFSNALDTLRGLRRTREAETLLDRRIATHPQDPALHATKVEFLLEARGDVRAARAELATLPQDNDPDGVAAYAHIYCDNADRDYDAVARDLARCPLPDIDNLPRQFYEGFLARTRRHDAAGAATAFAAARAVLAAQAHGQPDNFVSLAQSAVADAALGQKELALSEIHRAMALTAGDTLNEPNMQTVLIVVLGLAGERDEAIQLLRDLSGKPFGPEYGFMRFNPWWDSLRGDPRFEAIVAAAAPEIVGRRMKAEGGRRKAEGGRRKAEGGRRKAEGGRKTRRTL